MSIKKPEKMTDNINAYSWIGFISYVIIAYLIGYSSSVVFKRCPQIKDTEMADVDDIASSGIAFTTLALIGAIVLFSYCGYRGNVNDVLLRGPRSGDTTCMVIGGITFLFLLLSVALTASSEFLGVKAMNNCAVLEAASQDEVDEYLEAANMLNRLYGIVILAISLFLILSVYVALKNYLPGGRSIDLVDRLDRFVSFGFGRGARCRRGARGNKMKMKKRMYKL